MSAIGPSPQPGQPQCRVAIPAADAAPIRSFQLLLHAPDGGGTKAAQTLARRDPLAGSALDSAHPL